MTPRRLARLVVATAVLVSVTAPAATAAAAPPTQPPTADRAAAATSPVGSITITMDRSYGATNEVRLTYAISKSGAARSGDCLYVRTLDDATVSITDSTGFSVRETATSGYKGCIPIWRIQNGSLTLTVTSHSRAYEDTAYGDSWFLAASPVISPDRTRVDVTATTPGTDDVQYTATSIVAGNLTTRSVVIGEQPVTLTGPRTLVSRFPDRGTLTSSIAFVRDRYNVTTTQPVMFVVVPVIDGPADGVVSYPGRTAVIEPHEGAPDAGALIAHEYTHTIQTFTDQTTSTTDWLTEATAEFVEQAYYLHGLTTNGSIARSHPTRHETQYDWDIRARRTHASYGDISDEALNIPPIQALPRYANGDIALTRLNLRLLTDPSTDATVADVFTALQRFGRTDEDLTEARFRRLLRTATGVSTSAWYSTSVATPIQSPPEIRMISKGHVLRPEADPDQDGVSTLAELTATEDSSVTDPYHSDSLSDRVQRIQRRLFPAQSWQGLPLPHKFMYAVIGGAGLWVVWQRLRY